MRISPSALGRHLSAIAQREYNLRQFDKLKITSALLIGVDSLREFYLAGRYYQALVLYKSGAKDEAQAIIQQIINLPRNPYTAKSLSTLGAFSFYRGDLQTALQYWREALRCVKSSNDPLIALEAKRGLAILKSLDGNHKEAMSDIYPLVIEAQSLSVDHPLLPHACLNSLAVELCELGRLEEAQYFNQITLSSPFASAYPEWRDTYYEIILKQNRLARSVVVLTRWREEIKPSDDNRNLTSTGTVARIYPFDRNKVEKGSTIMKANPNVRKDQLEQTATSAKTNKELIREMLELMTKTKISRDQILRIISIIRE